MVLNYLTEMKGIGCINSWHKIPICTYSKCPSKGI